MDDKMMQLLTKKAVEAANKWRTGMICSMMEAERDGLVSPRDKLVCESLFRMHENITRAIDEELKLVEYDFTLLEKPLQRYVNMMLDIVTAIQDRKGDCDRGGSRGQSGRASKENLN